MIETVAFLAFIVFMYAVAEIGEMAGFNTPPPNTHSCCSNSEEN
jgi:hypothetical protein